MEAEQQVRCLICGEGDKGSRSCDETVQDSLALLQNYAESLDRYFQEEVNFRKEDVATVSCKSCSFYLNSVICGMERMEGLSKGVAELERNLRRKLRELKSNGDNVLSQLKLIEEAMIDHQNECLDLNQNEIYLRKGTEKACKSLTVMITEIENQLASFTKWTNAGRIQAKVEKSSTSDETCRIVSVTSMATPAGCQSFEAGEVFQVKTEQENDADTSSTGDDEPVLVGVVKIEKEFVRETRQGSVYRTKEISLPLALDTLKIVVSTENERSAGEPILIDLEEEEIIETSAVGNMSVSPSPPQSKDNHLENYENGAEGSEELRHLEAEKEDEISCLGVVEKETSEKPDKENCHIGMETFSSKTSMTVTENEKGDKASLRKRSIAEVDCSTEKTDNVGGKQPCIAANCFAMHDLPNAGTNLHNPDDDDDGTKKWFAEVTSLLRSKDNAAKLHKLLEVLPKLSPGLFHKLVLQLKEVNKLCQLTSISARNIAYNWGHEYPLFHEIFRKINVEERTLDILSGAGLDFNVLDYCTRNVLHAAVKGNQSVSLLKDLVKRGANVKQIDIFGENLIHFAVKHGRTAETLEFLINEGVDVNGLNREQKTPGSMLQNVKDPERFFPLFNVLANAGAHYLETALQDYFKSERPQQFLELFKYILGNAQWLNEKCDNATGATLVHLSLGCEKMDEEILQMLDNAQIDFTIVDRYGHGYLHYAVKGGNWSPKMLQFLIDKGAPVTTSRRNCETLLHIAARKRAPWETFEFLLDKGIKLGHKNCKGYTALDLVIQNSHEAKEGVITKLLIKAFDAGVRYSRYLSKQCPMLHLGIKYGTLEVVKHMLENGAAVNEVDSKGKPSFFMAIEEHPPDNVEKAKLLRRFGAVISLEVEERKKYLHVMAKAGMDPEVLKYCIDEFEVDADATLPNGKTLLYSILFASPFSNSMLSIAKTLIIEGADVNAKPKARFEFLTKSRSPLHLLLCRYNAKIDALSFLDILILLLEGGANINEKDVEGWTALHILMDNCSENSLELAKLLVQFGADIRAKTRKRQSVLHIAAGKKDIEKIQFCLSEGLDVNALDTGGKTPVEYFFLPGNRTYGYSNERACQMANEMKVLLDSGATAKTKADVKKKIQILLKSAWGNRSGVKVVLEKFLLLLK